MQQQVKLPQSHLSGDQLARWKILHIHIIYLDINITGELIAALVIQ